MSNHRGNIEILLLLCCIVGVVAFFCFGLGIAGLMTESESPYALVEEMDQLEEVKAQKQAQFDDLKNRKVRLEQEKDQDLAASAHGKEWTETERLEAERSLEELKKARDSLSREIDSRRRELAELHSRHDPKSRQERERELQKLLKQMEAMERQIAKKTAHLSAMEQDAGAESSSEKERRLKEELNGFRKKKETLGKELDELKTKSLWGGSSQFKNPLYVDCRKDAYILYPGARALGVAEMEDEKRFKSLSAGHDIVVLLVRPEGFDSFNKAYEKVGALSLPRSYEPVESDADLDFLRGAK
jgi:hypothetical protein